MNKSYGFDCCDITPIAGFVALNDDAGSCFYCLPEAKSGKKLSVRAGEADVVFAKLDCAHALLRVAVAPVFQLSIDCP